jgi:hypothetical protein
MSLRTLVAYAQQNFASFDELARVNPDEAVLGLPTEITRPPLPGWLEDDTPFEEFPIQAESWIIEGDADLLNPPANVDIFGVDALAFYLPFHFYRERWGIYVLSSGVVHLASVLKGGPLRPGDEAYLEVADWILIEHEQFHANVEISATRAEMIARRAMYWPYFRSSPAAQQEEGLANANAVRWALTSNEDPLDVQSKLEAWMKRQGPGYCEYDRFLSSRTFSSGLERTTRHLVKHLPGPAPKLGATPHTFLFRGARRYKMPLTRVHDLVGGNVSILRPFPKAHGLQVFVHTNDHPPAHIHIRSNGFETRYEWKSLKPLKGDSPLSQSGEKGLRRYLKEYGADIRVKVAKIYGEEATLSM